MDDTLKAGLVARATDAAVSRLGRTELGTAIIAGPAAGKSSRATPWQTQAALAHVGVYLTLPALAERGWPDRLHAFAWASAVQDATSEGEIPERPEWLPGRDQIACDAMMQGERPTEEMAHELFLAFDENWTEPAAIIEPDEEQAATFAEMLEEIDEEMVDELAAVGVNIQTPAENDAARWQLVADRLLESAQRDQAVVAESKSAEKMHIQMIKLRHERNRELAANRLERTLTFIRDEIAPRLNYGGKKKSIDLTHGSVGFKDYKATAKLESGEQTMAWAREHLPAAIATRTETIEELRTDVIANHAADTGAEIPGWVTYRERREWFAKPSKDAHPERGY